MSMFGKKHARLEVIIGPETIVRGELVSKGTVRIDGTVEGTISADCIIIGETGVIQGDVSCRAMIAAGKIWGNIRAGESVEIQPKGEVTGDIFTPRMLVSEGAVFEGRSIMQKNRELEFKPAELIQ